MIGQIYNHKNRLVLIACYLTTFLCFSCNDQQEKKHINIDHISIHSQSIRFDKALFQCDTNNLENSINQLGNTYPDFAAIYFNELTGFMKNNNQDAFLNSVKHFLTYKDFKGLYDSVQYKFPDVKEIDEDLATLFKHIKYYFPNEKWGTVYYFISGLNSWSAVTVDTLVGVGLDMHLGKNYPFYASVLLPDYQTARCEKEYIPVNVSKAIYENNYPIEADGKSLLDLMLMKGKEMIFAEYSLPNASDELLMGYTPEQLKWCKANEAMIWNYFAQQKLLYATAWQDIMRYVNDGPTSTGMPPESPGNIGTWIGWQIVRKYMSKNPYKTLQEVLAEQIDGQAFVRAAAYRPQ